MKFIKIFLILFVLLLQSSFLIAQPKGYGQVEVKLSTEDPGVQIKVVQKEGEEFAKAYSLYKGKEYFLGELRLQKGDALLGKIVKDKEGKWSLKINQPFKVHQGKIYFNDLVGCGWESDGTVLYQVNLDGSQKNILLGSCENVSLKGFFKFEGKDYLVIEEESGAIGGVSVWVLKALDGKPVVHVPGYLKSKEEAALEICPQTEMKNHPKFECYKVSWQDLVNRQVPVKSFSRFPIYAKTLKDQVSFWQEIKMGPMMCSSYINKSKEKPPLSSDWQKAIDQKAIIKKIIPNKNTQLILLDICGEKDYVAYYEGNFGIISAKDLSGFKVHSKENRFRH